MKPTIRNILAVIAGITTGMVVNMGIIMLSSNIIPLPEDVDPTKTESLKSSLHLFEPRHFIFPFLAHALGTFTGALIAATIAATHKMKFAISIGILFLLAGIANVIMLPAPMWFSTLDLVVAYIPMGYLAGKLTTRRKVA
jgi:hypothetical protein